MIKVFKVFEPSELDNMRVTLGMSRIMFSPGTLVGQFEAHKKNNLELEMSGQHVDMSNEIKKKVGENMEYINYALPKGESGIIFSMMEEGGYFKPHHDLPYVPELNMRTDISHTLFISDQDEYDGGELVIEGTPYKLPRGYMVCYPSRLRHEVKEVTDGQRVVAVWWAESYIRDTERREITGRIDNRIYELMNDKENADQVDFLCGISYSLKRMWLDIHT